MTVRLFVAYWNDDQKCMFNRVIDVDHEPENMEDLAFLCPHDDHVVVNWKVMKITNDKPFVMKIREMPRY